jgi:hypothetical protein
VVALAPANSGITSVMLEAATVVNLHTNAPEAPVKPKPPVEVVPTYLYDSVGSVTVSVFDWLLLALLSSAGTEIVIRSLPSTVGVNGANVTVVAAPQLASDGMICVSVNDSAPVIVSVTGRFVSVLLPLLTTIAWIACAPLKPSGTWP